MNDRHAELFPLPAPWMVELVRRPGLSRKVRQRVERRRAMATACAESVAVLNGAALGSQESKGSLPSLHPFQSPGVHSRKSMLEGPVFQACCRFEFSLLVAISALLQAGSQYDQEPMLGLASFVSRVVSYPSNQIGAAPLLLSLEGDVLSCVRDVDGRMLLVGRIWLESWRDRCRGVILIQYSPTPSVVIWISWQTCRMRVR